MNASGGEAMEEDCATVDLKKKRISFDADRGFNLSFAFPARKSLLTGFVIDLWRRRRPF